MPKKPKIKAFDKFKDALKYAKKLNRKWNRYGFEALLYTTKKV